MEFMTVEELKALLRARGLPVTGTKAELIAPALPKPIPPPNKRLLKRRLSFTSEEAATSSEGVSDNNAEDSGPDEPLGEQPSG